jgi:DNA repair exonuclease SbcCD ATPase subunit/DNA repair exonuclease SbcCD nuclease subunit
MIQKIDIGLTKIDKIYHLADIHIRNLKRHKEYKTVFARTVDYIKSTIQPNDIIFLGGDIVHAKTDMTPELVQSVQEFFKMFSDIAPTILITGNHDCNLNNASRLDALTPIVNALNHPNLYYLKDSGVYEMADKHFVVMSVFDKPKDFIRANTFEGKYKIALHHGAVNNAVTDIGFRLVNDHVDVALFDGYELTLLGDIHKPAQYLNEAKTIAYPGSLIQQNYAEALIHGLLVWDTDSKKSEFVEIPNDKCYYTLEIDKGVYTPLPDLLLGKTIRLRVKVQSTDAADLKSILAEVKTKFNIDEYTIQKINDFTTNKTRVQKINIGDVRDVEYQNELISKYLDNKFALSEEMLDGIRHVNRTVNSSISRLDSTRNVSWIPKRFEFSNMFSYGANNYIDFENMKGVHGIFAPNASGKSTMLDAITYCIFDKCGRTSKAANVLNNQSTSFSCKFTFELDDIIYVIEKTGTKGRGNHVRVDVDFYSIDSSGNQESLNGKERSETNDHIRNILGTYEDFVLTALSVQNNNSGFIDMAQKDRKDLLSQFLDINIFEDLYSAANTDIKEVATLVKEYQKQDFSTQLAEANNKITIATEQSKELNTLKASYQTSIDIIDADILELTKQLIPVDTSIENITELNLLKEKATLLSSQLQVDLQASGSRISTVDNEIDSLRLQLNEFNISEIQARIDVLNECKKTEKELHGTVERLKAEVRAKLEKMEKLNDLKYDENCKFCMDNVFVKDAIATKASIETDKLEAKNIINQLEIIRTKIQSLEASLSEKESYNSLSTSIHQKESLKLKLESDVHQIDNRANQLTTNLEKVNNKIDEYYKKESIIKTNSQLKLDIDLLADKKSELQTLLHDVSDQLMNCNSRLIMATATKEKAEESIDKLKNLEKQYKYYEYYLEAVNRDGVPYDLITMAVPYIEQEINNILSQLVEFNLMLEMDGKNINCYIVYDQDNFWPIELTSGMEKFISSLAIRTALINISSLPRPNFLAIDEGFGVLDSDNLNSMFNLFDYLKTQFSFMLVISHIDSMRDVVDKLIEITKVNGSSKIQYSYTT